jgi:hypothetical protein
VTDNDHWPLLLRYAREELAAGGPDPQIAIVADALVSADVTEWERVVMAGQFVNCYTVAAAAVQWSTWRQFGGLGPAWFEWAWGPADRLPMRKERRPVKSPAKLARCNDSWRRWAAVSWPVLRRKSYNEVYASVLDEVWGLGRYAAIKVLETLHRAGLLDHAIPDMRAKGHPFGRRALAALYPSCANELADDSARSCSVADGLAAEVRLWLADQGVDVSWYAIEVFLCTYRQALTGKYPGRSQDRELAYWLAAEGVHGGPGSLDAVLPFRQIRRRLFDPAYLGEVGGWSGARPALEAEWKALAGDLRV